MKEKVLDNLPERIYCPSCHKELRSPLGRGVSFQGNMIIECSICKKGKVIIDIKNER